MDGERAAAGLGPGEVPSRLGTSGFLRSARLRLWPAQEEPRPPAPWFSYMSRHTMEASVYQRTRRTSRATSRIAPITTPGTRSVISMIAVYRIEALLRGYGPGSLHPSPARSYQHAVVNLATSFCIASQASPVPGPPDSKTCPVEGSRAVSANRPRPKGAGLRPPTQGVSRRAWSTRLPTPAPPGIPDSRPAPAPQPPAFRKTWFAPAPPLRRRRAASTCAQSRLLQ